MTVLTPATYRSSGLAVSIMLAFLFSPFVETLRAAPSLNPPKNPNILFFIMDDVGVDQFEIFGYGGVTPPLTPNINAIARAGVRFRNTWAMPECSPSRAIFFEGRFPLRTNVLNAILSLDLANSQVSPFETTTPLVLKKKGYESGLFGKFHLTSGPLQSHNNPYGYTVVHALGWDFFAGYLDGAPFPIDTTAGGVGAKDPTTDQGPYGCGFVPNAMDDPENGADNGACYFADSSCTTISKSPEQPTPGRACLNQGGIFVPKQSCQSSPPAGVNFNNQNAYYVGQLVINNEDGSVEVVPFTDPRARVYRSTIESDLAINWINQRDSKKPWMATVSYSSAHTPYQQPPTALLPLASVDTNGFNCTDLLQQRVLSNQMIESMDKELGRVMVEVGLATRKLDGTLDYHPEATDTMVIIVSDNGTFLPGVKAPLRSESCQGYAVPDRRVGALDRGWAVGEHPEPRSAGHRQCRGSLRVVRGDRRRGCAQGSPQVPCPRFCLHAPLPDQPQSREHSDHQLHPDRQQHKKGRGRGPTLRRYRCEHVRTDLHLAAALRIRGRDVVWS